MKERERKGVRFHTASHNMGRGSHRVLTVDPSPGFQSFGLSGVFNAPTGEDNEAIWRIVYIYYMF